MTGKEKIYIERQKNYTKQRGSFGPLGNVSGNGCGAIALYNVLTYFGIRTEFMSIVNRFNRIWPLSMSCGGLLGTNIFHLFYELKHYKFTVYPVFFTRSIIRKFHMDENAACIFLYGWKKKLKPGAHYQAGFGNPDGTENMWYCMALMIRKK